MRNNFIGAVMISLVVILTTGCWDRREVNDVAFVMGTALDKEGDKYRASIQVALPSQLGGSSSGGSGGGGGGSGKAWALFSKSGETIRIANNMEQAGIPRQLYFAHRRTFLVGEDMAKEGIAPLMDILGRLPQNRLSVFMVITEGPALPYMKVTSEIERFPSEIVRELAAAYMKSPAMAKTVIHRLLSEGMDLAIPAVRIVSQETGPGASDKTTIKMDGMAVFKDDKLVKQIFGQEAEALLLAMGEAQMVEVPIKPPRGKGTIVLRVQRPNVKLNPKVKSPDDIKFTLTLEGNVSVVENASAFDTASDSHLNELEEVLNTELEGRLKDLIKQLQTEYRSDPIGFAQTLYFHKPQLWRHIKNKWEMIYPTIKVEVISAMHMENTGTVLKPLGIQEEEMVE
ncbi:Ger(x)C family spore germination protein [Paenibacillus sambharensis]|uniref:Ger(X)C family spore germination protein n=1 Tax=Paenibacillus sambharensis TaxID=1803190 RepID=A0A2W1L955_9BACL|nr:Ger(x)C family spore germination protein [Paenibacillus sambharensis]PZD95766.1 Ger(x)C family spore germination protein [Paenibacillus sambharensis]